MYILHNVKECVGISRTPFLPFLLKKKRTWCFIIAASWNMVRCHGSVKLLSCCCGIFAEVLSSCYAVCPRYGVVLLFAALLLCCINFGIRVHLALLPCFLWGTLFSLESFSYRVLAQEGFNEAPSVMYRFEYHVFLLIISF